MAQQTPAKSLTINDFSPGIFNRRMFTGVPQLPAPQGAAQLTNTFRCRSMPGGGLGPMPGVATKYTAPGITGVAGSIFPSVLGGNILIEGNTGTAFRFKWYKINYYTGALVDATASTLVYGTAAATVAYSTYAVDAVGQTAPTGSRFSLFNSTQVNTSALNFGNPGTLGVAFTGQVAQFGTSPIVLTSQYTATDKTIWTRNTGGGGTGNFVGFGPGYLPIGYLGRILIGQSPGPAELSRMANTPFNVVFQSTIGPPEYSLMDTGGNVLTFTDLTALGGLIGAWGSISSGELFIILKQGGGLLISGDIYNPSVTFLPGVSPTGFGVQMRAIPTRLGLMYLAEGQGVMVWDGSNTAQNISKNLDPDFPIRSVGILEGENVSALVWNNLVLWTHNYVYDLDTQSWWRIEDTSVVDIGVWDFHTAVQVAGYPDSYSGSALANVIQMFSYKTLASSWSWQSHPLPTTVGRLVDVRNIEILAQSSTGGTITVTLTAKDNTTKSVVFTLPANSTRPSRLRKNIGIQCDGIITRIQATDNASNPAPLLYEITFEYHDSNSLAG